MAEPSILGALRDPQFRSDTLRNLVEALNGAQRSLTVGSLGAVGDMGNTLANLVRAGAGTAYHEATGRPIPQALEYRDPARDFGTSASLGNFAERQGWLPPQTGSIPETAGALLGPIAAMGLPDLGNATLRGLVAAAKSEPSRRMIEGYVDALGARPKAIVWHGSPHQFDAFDSSKIGTGEGRQQQGIGSYLAEAKGVAQKYADKESWKLGMESGYLYKVDAPDSMIASMANHDLPLSAQPGNVRSAVMSILDADTKKALRDYHGWNDPLDAPFAAVLDALEIAKGNNRAAASESLRNAGIPGIRYLDGGSRADGAGTSNFVVFPGEESALTILERNGKPVRK